MSDENKSTLGLRDVYYALVTQDDSSAYAADTPVYFAPVVTASAAPASNSKTQYADDGPYDVFASEGETKIDFEVTGISNDVLAEVLGKVYDAASGRLFDNGGTPPDVAMSFRAVKSNGKYRYFQYLKGKFSAPSEEQASKTDTPDPKTIKITYTAVKTTYQFDLGDINDGVKRVIGDEDSSGFSGTSWFGSVQVPSAGSPSSLTCTPSPADGATGVAVGVSPTLTFNNALRTGTFGVTLTLDDGTIVASAYSIDAANKVITINPTADLSGTSTYLISISVQDVYGQTLRAVYDFTTT